MRNKIIFTVMIFCLTFTNTNASKFKFIFSPESKAVISDNQDLETNIYCDTINHWCNYSANKLYSENIFTGIKIGAKYYFEPDEQITRGDFLLYIDAILKVPYDEKTSPTFEDIKSIPVWQKNTVYGMYNAGIVHGNSENGKIYFNSDEKISRIEAAQILNNSLELKENDEISKYSDSYLIPKFASNAVKNISDYGIMQGYDDNSFRPYVKINRAMLADILCRLNDYYTNINKK